MHQCIYLHGFASGPASSKAIFFSAQLRQLGLKVHVPDLSGNSFTTMTLTTQLNLVREIIATVDTDDLFIVGSSMGGLLSVLIANECPKVRSLVLLAPGFGLNRRWNEQLTPDQIAQWKENGLLPVFNHATNSHVPLNYGFIEDVERYKTDQLTVNVPTLVMHGINDTVVPIYESESFYQLNSELVQLNRIDSDHGLLDRLPELWSLTHAFLRDNSAI